MNKKNTKILYYKRTYPKRAGQKETFFVGGKKKVP